MQFLRRRLIHLIVGAGVFPAVAWDATAQNYPSRPITLADATVRKRFADQGQDVPPLAQQRPEALAARQKAEIEKWWPIVKAANLKGE